MLKTLTKYLPALLLIPFLPSLSHAEDGFRGLKFGTDVYALATANLCTGENGGDWYGWKISKVGLEKGNLEQQPQGHGKNGAYDLSNPEDVAVLKSGIVIASCEWSALPSVTSEKKTPQSLYLFYLDGGLSLVKLYLQATPGGLPWDTGLAALRNQLIEKYGKAKHEQIEAWQMNLAQILFSSGKLDFPAWHRGAYRYDYFDKKSVLFSSAISDSPYNKLPNTLTYISPNFESRLLAVVEREKVKRETERREAEQRERERQEAEQRERERQEAERRAAEIAAQNAQQNAEQNQTSEQNPDQQNAEQNQNSAQQNAQQNTEQMPEQAGNNTPQEGSHDGANQGAN
ncbi:hypothetical protein FAI40_04195 [Acetobacteraceae bacterium]|nr:hypothetical protein FAI40_04195 [Acetobacteraceae bacterium]